MENFVDRYDELAIIRHLLVGLTKREFVQFPIREYVGIGGIGKTAFLRQVVAESDRLLVPCIYIDFEEFRIEPGSPTTKILNKLFDKINIEPQETGGNVIKLFADYYGVIIFDGLNLVKDNDLVDVAENIIFPLSEVGHILVLLGSRTRVEWGKPKYRLWRRTKSTTLLSFPLAITSEQLSQYSDLASNS